MGLQAVLPRWSHNEALVAMIRSLSQVDRNLNIRWYSRP